MCIRRQEGSVTIRHRNFIHCAIRTIRGVTSFSRKAGMNYWQRRKSGLQSRRKNHRRKVMKKQHRHRMTKSALTFTGIPAVAIFLSLTVKTKCG
ncbi:hypothetical protein [Escherichia Stx1 converting phage]|uniref:Uncharacterized protein n=2 Tax=Traversvirus TaxID=1981157 RepID=Q7Y2S1_9CAUD|nr:hypothetical protein Stx1_p061 [Escherichia Stx1 converting phage]NP_859305.1 hypothetical protein Stx2II_p060 [Escherichia phage Stx2 II]EZA36775.1 hypothetical protein BW70_03555 [Escherichia coli O174:H8 str. 04-3038]BAB87908.1 hypothetical protein [Stx2 converting phage I]BAC77876.1 hypothetical protein [Escherichia Stx1 converting phage]BAC78042.1 hypothetical protein [Escherichia phage Stx2 II]